MTTRRTILGGSHETLVPSTVRRMAFCVYCGKNMEDGQAFCVWCGKPSSTATAPAPAQHLPAQALPAEPAAVPAAPLNPYRPVLAIVGIIVVTLSTVLPWVSVFGASVNAWDVPFFLLLTNEATATEFSTGIVLLVVILGAIPLLTGRPLPVAASVTLGAVAVSTGALAIFRLVSQPTPRPGIGIGVYLTLAGGVLVAYEGVRAHGRRPMGP